MTEIPYEVLYQFLKQQKIVLNDYLKTNKGGVLKNNKLNSRFNVAFREGIYQTETFKYTKSSSFIFQVDASLYKITLTEILKNKDKPYREAVKINFPINCQDESKCWYKYIIHKDIAYAETMREQSQKDIDTLKKWLDDQKVITLADAETRTKREKMLEKLQKINNYATQYMDNFARSLGERE